MKKKVTIFGMMMCLCFITPTLKAQDYKQSIGVMAGLLNGVTYKIFLTDYIAFQADAGVNMELFYYNSAKGMPWSINVKPTFVWQNYIGRTDVSWFAGLGFNGGYCFKGNSPEDWEDLFLSNWTSINTGEAKVTFMNTEGLEYTLSSIPLTFQLEGAVGVGFRFSKQSSLAFHLDLMAAFSVRYTFK